MLFDFIGRIILTERNMNGHILDEGYRTRSSISHISISNDAKYLHGIRTKTLYHISKYVIGNLFPQSDRLIHTLELPRECPLIAAAIINVDMKKLTPLKYSIDIVEFLTHSSKKPLTFTPNGAIIP